MVAVPGGEFVMGSDAFYPEERPVHRVAVEAFWIDARPVTVGQFRRFVTETGYVTVAERPLDPDLYPDADPALLVPGSLVFRPTRGPVDLSDWRFSDGETRTRTRDTTIFRRVALAAESGGFAGLSDDSGPAQRVRVFPHFAVVCRMKRPMVRSVGIFVRTDFGGVRPPGSPCRRPRA